MPANKLSENVELTTAEKQVLGAYREHLEQHGAPPTLRYLAAIIGVGHSAVFHTLRRLKAKGYMQEKRVTAVRLCLSAKGKKVEL